MIRTALAAALLLSACAGPLQQTRRPDDDLQAPLPREEQDLESFRKRSCNPRLALLFPGVGAACLGRKDEGYAFAALGAAELGTGLAVALKDNLSNPGAALPLLAFGDLYTASVVDVSLRAQRAQRLAYVPQESMPELLAAPFDPEVLNDPMVWGGILGTVALGVGFEALVDGYDTSDAFKRPRLFGRDRPSLTGYPAAFGIGAGLFSHVAMAEEMSFRGLLQSGWARSYGETKGYVIGTLVFGGFHATNALFMQPSDRAHYLLTSVPFITLVGGYLGWVYKERGYSLRPSTAVHFWYDLLLSAVDFVTAPKSSPLAVTLQW